MIRKGLSSLTPRDCPARLAVMGDEVAKAKGDRGTVMVLALCCIALSLGVYKGLSWLAGRSADAELSLLDAEDRRGEGIQALSAKTESRRDISAWAAAGLGLAVFAVAAGMHLRRSRAEGAPADGEGG